MAATTPVTNARTAAAALRSAAEALLGQAAALDAALASTSPTDHLGAVDHALDALDSTLGLVEAVVEWGTSARLTLQGRVAAASAPPAPAADVPAAPAPPAPMPSPAQAAAPAPETVPTSAGKTVLAPAVGTTKPPKAPKADGLTDYRALQDMCRKAGLSAKGTARDLAARLDAHTAQPRKADPAPAPTAPPAAPKTLPAGAHLELARRLGVPVEALVDALSDLKLALVAAS